MGATFEKREDQLNVLQDELTMNTRECSVFKLFKEHLHKWDMHNYAVQFLISQQPNNHVVKVYSIGHNKQNIVPV